VITENVQKLKSQIKEHEARLLHLSDDEMQKTLGPGLWSGKEILGHLSDSAAMNRQRIVRSQYEELYDFPFYDQAKWVQIQAYHRCAWSDLVSRCLAECQHLAYILGSFPDESASDKCPIKFSSRDYVTLDWLVGDIYRHNDHHLHQIYWLVGQSDLPDDRELYQPIEELPR
jgi:hypothetical protein